MVARKHARAVGRASGAREKLAWGPWTARRLLRFDGAELAAKARARALYLGRRDGRATTARQAGTDELRYGPMIHQGSEGLMVPPDPWFRMEHAGSSVYLGTPTGPARLTAAEQARQVVAGPDKLQRAVAGATRASRCIAGRAVPLRHATMLRPGVATLSKAEHGSVCQSPTTSGQCLQAGRCLFNSLDDRRPYAPPACAPSPDTRGQMAVAQHRSARKRPPAARGCHAPPLHWHANTCSRTTLPPHARTSGGHATSPRRLAPTVDGHTSPLHKEALACGGRTPLHPTVDQTHHPEGRHPEGQHAALFRKPPPPPTPRPSKNTSPSSKNRPLL